MTPEQFQLKVSRRKDGLWRWWIERNGLWEYYTKRGYRTRGRAKYAGKKSAELLGLRLTP